MDTSSSSNDSNNRSGSDKTPATGDGASANAAPGAGPAAVTANAAGAATAAPSGGSAKRQLLIVEDDEAFARTLARSFERRGYAVLQAASLSEVEAILTQHTPGYAVVDLKLKGDASGLACVQKLHAASEAMLIVVLTGFASIATAVEAVKLGACHYLAKPSNTDDIEAAFGLKEGDTEVDVTNRSSSLKTLEWERIHEVLAETGFNISETARRLGMHRRTLARKLEKQQVS